MLKNNLEFELAESRKCYQKELQTIVSKPSVRLPNNLKMTSLLSEVESSYSILDHLKAEFDQNMQSITKAKKIQIFKDKISEIKAKYGEENLEESIQDWPLDILAFLLTKKGLNIDLTYFGGQLVMEYHPAKNYGYQFENELKNIAQGVADYKFLNELENEYSKTLKGNPPSGNKKKPFDRTVKINIDRDIIPELWRGLMPYFKEKQHEELRITLLGDNGHRLPLVFQNEPSNRLLEVFRRAYYNERVKGTKRLFAEWISHHFAYVPSKKRISNKKVIPFSISHISNCLSKEIGDIPNIKNRICKIATLPYKSISELKEL